MLGNNHIIISTRSTINISLGIYACGSEIMRPNMVWGPKVLDSYILYYVYEGKGILEVGGEKFSVQKGQGFLIPRNVLSSFTADEEEPMKTVWVDFNGYLAEVYLLRAKLSEHSPIFTYDEDDFFLVKFKEMVKASKRRFNRYCTMMSILYQMFAKLLDIANSTEGGEIKDTTELYLRRALEFIEMNYTTKLTIDNLSKHVGLDRKYLYSIFKKRVGESPQEYLINYRMDMAGRLLENSNLSVSNIARSVGYSNPFHFSKIFKNVKKVPPTQFRENFRTELMESKKYNDIDDKEELLKIIKEKDSIIYHQKCQIDELEIKNGQIVENTSKVK